mgnify:FL=1
MRMTVPSLVNLRLRIYDMTGRTAGEQEIVANSTEWGTTLDISPLSAGMYMVAIEGEGIQILRKFIKE